jgi:D-sedoheptulose 7-phosphate isomerase
MNFFERNLRDHLALFDRLGDLSDDVWVASALMTSTLRSGGRLLFFGNGGSASDAQHIAAEFSGRFALDRAPLAAMALCADSAAMTAIANDYGFTEVYARQVMAHGRAGDCAIGISTSGASKNVLRGLQAARSGGMRTVALLGRDGGAALALADAAVVVPHQDSARIQEAHIFIGHTWAGMVETTLGLA